MIKEVGLVVKDSIASLNLGKQIGNYLSSKGIELFFDETSAKKLDVKGCKIQEMKADLIIVLGGDGTILKTVSLISGKKIPLLGINTGTMGFLTQIAPKDWKPALDRVLKGRYSLDERTKISVEIDGKRIGDALNEVVVATSMPVKMLHLEVSVDKRVVDTVRADGIIVSTPTGSTAYSMSAGGAVIDPRVRAFIATLICPFEYKTRSIVVPQSSKIKVKLLKSKKDAIVVIDGEYIKNIAPKDEVTFKLSKNEAYFVKF